MYKPLGEIVPHCSPEPEQSSPMTFQITARLEVPVTVAENVCCELATSCTRRGEMLTVTPDFAGRLVGPASKLPFVWVVKEMETQGEVLAGELARQWRKGIGSADAAPSCAVHRGIP